MPPSQFSDCWMLLDRDRCLDAGMSLVIFQREIGILKREDVSHRRIEPHGRQRIRLARELLFRLFDMVEVEMSVAETVHEFAGL